MSAPIATNAEEFFRQQKKDSDLAKRRGNPFPRIAALEADTDWITVSSFSNSFTSAAAPENVAYRKLGKVVRLGGGLLRASGTGSSLLAAFTLPAGFRPGKTVTIMTIPDSLAAFAAIRVTPAGVVAVWYNAAISTSPGIALGGVSFIADN